MPRPIRQRSVQGEGNLARRIQQEREYRGLSYEALAKLMTDVGCKMQGSAIFKIEKADPPRRITVDELVAFSQVFDVTVENLLTPVEVLRTKRGKELLKQIDAADADLFHAVGKLLNAFVQYFDIAAYEPDMRAYIDGHRFTRDVSEERASSTPLFTLRTDDGDDVARIDSAAFKEAVSAFYQAIIKESGDAAMRVIEHNKAHGIFAGPYAEDDD